MRPENTVTCWLVFFGDALLIISLSTTSSEFNMPSAAELRTILEREERARAARIRQMQDEIAAAEAKEKRLAEEVAARLEQERLAEEARKRAEEERRRAEERAAKMRKRDEAEAERMAKAAAEAESSKRRRVGTSGSEAGGSPEAEEPCWYCRTKGVECLRTR